MKNKFTKISNLIKKIKKEYFLKFISIKEKNEMKTLRLGYFIIEFIKELPP